MPTRCRCCDRQAEYRHRSTAALCDTCERSVVQFAAAHTNAELARLAWSMVITARRLMVAAKGVESLPPLPEGARPPVDTVVRRPSRFARD